MSALPGVTQRSHRPSPAPDLAWQKRALCVEVDSEIFFPGKGDLSAARAAKRICAACEVRAQCLDYALAHCERYGVWGGLSERQRRNLPRGKARG